MADQKPGGNRTGHIFISHAETDKDLVDALVDLIVIGTGLNDAHIFCTSLEGLGIPEGESFIHFIREKMQDPSLVIMVITPCYFESVFCLCELGATWAMSHSAFPLICPPLNFTDLKAVLTEKQAAMIDREEKLDNLRDRIVKTCHIDKPPSTGRWNSKRDQFLEKLPDLLSKVSVPTKVPLVKYSELKDTYKEVLKDNSELSKQIQIKNDIIEELKKAKTAIDVEEILLNGMDEMQQFEHLIKEAKSALGKLPRIATEALYYRYNGGRFDPSYWDNSIREEVKDAEERNFIFGAEDNDIRPNLKKLPIGRADKALERLGLFLRSAAYEFHEAFSNKYEIDASIADRGFWEDFLGLISS